MYAKQRAINLFTKYPPGRFEYNPEDKQFTIGKTIVALAQYADHRASVNEPISEESAGELIDNSNLLVLHQRPLLMPSLHFALKALNTIRLKNLTDNVTQSLMDAYADATSGSKARLLKGSLWGFGAEMLRPGHPNLTVLGNCACSGITPDGIIFRETAFDEGFGEFDLHNIDRPEQGLALMAGIGSFAYWIDKV